MKGKFIVIVGPSASGKTELVSALIKKIPSSTRLVTTTTREKRAGEKDGENYFFVSRLEFEKSIKAGDFFEYAEVYGNLYGSSKKVLEQALQKFKFVFAIIDVVGARSLKTKIPDALTIFINPGSLGDIKKRLQKVRAGISEDELEKRMEAIKHELSLADTFDVVIENKEGEFDMTVEKVLQLLGK